MANPNEFEIDEEGVSIAEAGEEEKQSGSLTSPAKTGSRKFPVFKEDGNVKEVEILNDGDFKVIRRNENNEEETFYISNSGWNEGKAYIKEPGKTKKNI